MNKIHKGDYIETYLGNGYVLKANNKENKYTISSAYTAFEPFCSTITVPLETIKKVLPKHYYVLSYSDNLSEDYEEEVFDTLKDARKKARKWLKKLDQSRYSIYLEKHLRRTNEWVDDLDL